MNAPSTSFARNDDGRMSRPLSSIVCSKFPTNRAIAHLFSVRCSCLRRRRLSISREPLGPPTVSLPLPITPHYSPYLHLCKDIFTESDNERTFGANMIRVKPADSRRSFTPTDPQTPGFRAFRPAADSPQRHQQRRQECRTPRQRPSIRLAVLPDADR